MSARSRVVTASISAAVAGLLLAGGCAGGVDLKPPAGPSSRTVMGNYEAIASCVAEAGRSSATGAPVLRVDRPKKTALVQRVLEPSKEVQYEIRFVQTGAGSVLAEGLRPGATDAARGFDFVWVHVEQCAINLTAP